jgi:hypothetical protein
MAHASGESVVRVMQFSAHWCTTGAVVQRSPSRRSDFSRDPGRLSRLKSLLHSRQTESCIALLYWGLYSHPPHCRLHFGLKGAVAWESLAHLVKQRSGLLGFALES